MYIRKKNSPKSTFVVSFRCAEYRDVAEQLLLYFLSNYIQIYGEFCLVINLIVSYVDSKINWLCLRHLHKLKSMICATKWTQCLQLTLMHEHIIIWITLFNWCVVAEIPIGTCHNSKYRLPADPEQTKIPDTTKSPNMTLTECGKYCASERHMYKFMGLTVRISGLITIAAIQIFTLVLLMETGTTSVTNWRSKITGHSYRDLSYYTIYV